MKRIAIVGPVVPFRGGIAHHTTRLAEAISAYAETSVISFARLYPKIIYPGQFQIDQSDTRCNLDVKFDLDAINPATWRQVDRVLESLQPDLVVIPWWTQFLAPCVSYLTRRLKLREVPVIFMCHNVTDHDAGKLRRWISRRVLRRATGFVTHARSEKDEITDLVRDANVLFHPHPAYDSFPKAKGTLPRRAALELLFFGLIRPYKGLEVLVDALARLNDLDLFISIVGEPWKTTVSYWRKRFSEAEIRNIVDFVPRYVSDAEAAEYFDRADVVVMPYLSATGTGIAALACQYEKPLVASDIGGLSDVVIDGVTGILVPPGDRKSLANAIRRFAINGIPNLSCNIRKHKTELSWDSLARMMIDRFS